MVINNSQKGGTFGMNNLFPFISSTKMIYVCHIIRNFVPLLPQKIH